MVKLIKFEIFSLDHIYITQTLKTHNLTILN